MVNVFSRLRWPISRGTALVAAFMLALPAGLAAQAASVAFSYVKTVVPSAGLVSPKGVAVDAAGNVFVADSSANKIYKLPAGGGATVTVISTGLSQPQGIAVDAAGNLYVAQAAATTLAVYPAGGGSATTLATGLSGATGLWLDQSGNIYIADTGNNRIVTIPTAGGTQTPITGFSGPRGVVVDSQGTMFVADYGNLRVRRIPTSGSPSNAISSISAYGIAVDPSDNVFAADKVSNSVQEFNHGLFASNPYLTTGLSGPTGMAAGPDGSLYIADTGNSRIVRLQTQGISFPNTQVGSTSAAVTFTFTITVPGNGITPAALVEGVANKDLKDAGTGTCTTNGAAYNYMAGDQCTVDVTFAPAVPHLRSGAVVLYDTTQTPLATVYFSGSGTSPQIAFSVAAQTVVASGLTNPYGIAVDANGDLFIADSGNNRILKKTLSGGVYTSSTVATGLSTPYGLAVDGAGNIFEADSGSGFVYEETPSGTSFAQAQVGSDYTNPYGVAVDAFGNVYVADAGNNSVVEDIFDGIGYSTVTPISVATGLSAPHGVAVDQAGNVYVADTGNHQVLKETPTTGGLFNQTIVVTDPSIHPHGLAVDAAGNVYYADPTNQKVVKETLSGGTYTASTVGTGLSAPTGVWLDGTGAIYIADSGLNEIIKVDPTGASTLPTIAFASTAVGATSSDSPTTVTVYNTGNAALSFEVPSSGNNPVITANFTLDSTSSGTCPLIASGGTAGSLAANSSCTLPLSFSPTTAGNPLTGSITLQDNNLNAAGPSYATQTLATSGVATQETPTHMAAAGLPTTVYAGGNPGTFTVTIENASNLAVASSTASVSLAITGPGGYTLNASANAVAGVATFNLGADMLSAVGTYTFTIASTSLPSLTPTVTVAAPPTQIAVTGISATLLAGGNLGTETATIEDANGNTVITFAGTVTATITGPHGYAQAPTVAAVGGVATFTLTGDIVAYPGTYTIVTTAPGGLTTTNTIVVSLAQSSISLAASTTSAINGAPITLTATGLKLPANTALTPGQVSFTYMHTALGITVPGSFGTVQLASAGTAALTVRPGAGTYVVTAVFGGTASIASASSTTQTITVTGNAQQGSTSTASFTGTPGNYSLTATVGGFGLLTPTGVLSFLDTTAANASLATVTLDPTTASSSFTSAAGSPLSVPNIFTAVAADLNQDGIADLVTVTCGGGGPTVHVQLGNGDGTFQTAVTYTTSNCAIAAAVADLNSDGKPDLLISNAAGQSVTVMLGAGDGTFTAQTPVLQPGLTNAQNTALATADLNQDGILDLVVVDAGDSVVAVFLGVGDGTFHAQQTYAIGASASSVAIADVNGDGILDLAVSNQNDASVSILTGVGDGAFNAQSTVNYPTGNSIGAALLASLRNNGVNDLIVPNLTANNVAVSLGNNDGTFAAPILLAYPAAGPTYAAFRAATADVNQDGFLDVVVSFFGRIGVFYGHGDGTFSPIQLFPTGQTLNGTQVQSTILAADFNNDGLTDFVIADEADATVAILLGQRTASGTVTGLAVPGPTVQNVAASYPGDAAHTASVSPTIPLLPLVTTTMLSATPASAVLGAPITINATVASTVNGAASSGTVSFYHGATLLATENVVAGVATYTTSSLTAGYTPITAVYSGSATLGTSTSASLLVFVGTQTATTLTVSTTTATAGTPLVLTAHSATVPANTAIHPGQVTFNYLQTTGGITLPGTFATVQLTSTGTATLTLRPGPGVYVITAVFAGVLTSGPSSSAPATVTIAAAANYSTSTALTSTGSTGNYTLAATTSAFGLLAPTGTISFLDMSNGNAVVTTAGLDPASVHYSPIVAPGSPFSDPGIGTVATGDFNNDGNQDIVTTHGTSVRVQLGNGDGTFQPITVANTYTLSLSTLIVAADVDGDGNQDLLVLSPSGGTITILTGNGDGTFNNVSPQTLTTGTIPDTLAVADLNRDGRLDIVAGNVGDDTINVFLGGAGGIFQSGSTIIPGPQGTVEPVSMTLADVNGDGFPDVVTSDPGNNTLGVFLGDGMGGLGSNNPVLLPVGAAPGAVVSGSLRGNGIIDLVVAGHNLGSLMIYLGNNDGTFAAPTVLGTGIQTIALADVNHDGKLDIVAVTNLLAPYTLSVFPGLGDGTFGPEQDIALAENTESVTIFASADFNGDGLPDFISTNNSHVGVDLTILLGQQVATATANGVYVTGTGPQLVDAVYAGDATHMPSQSTTVSLTPSTQVASSVLLASSGATVAAGASVTFTATIAPLPSGASLGTVSFYSNGALLATQPVAANGTATYGTIALALGVDQITAVYSGNAGLLTGNASPFNETVLTATAIVLTGSTTSIGGQAITLTATITPAPTGSPVGTVTFYQNGVALPGTAVPNAGGTATLSVITLNVGADAITAVYSGDALYATSTSVVETITVAAGGVQIAISPLPATVAIGGHLNALAATIEDSNGNVVTTSTATVIATITGPGGYSQAVPATAVNGVATFNLAGLVLTTPGLYTVTVSANGLPSATSTFSVTGATQLSLGPIPSTVSLGGNLGTVVARLQDANGAIVTNVPASVTATLSGPNGYSQAVTVTTVSGVASLNLSGLTLTTAGTYTLTVTTAGLTTATATFIVPKAATAATVTSSNLTPPYGQAIVLTANLAPAPTDANPGTVTFLSGTTVLGNAAVSASGVATFSIVLPLGANSITAVYSGSANFAASTSSALAVSSRAASAVSFSISPTTQLFNNPILLTAQVTSPTPGTFAGTVSFLDGTTVLATAPVGASGQASASASTIPAGKYNLTAAFSGNTNFGPSLSTGATVAVTVADLDLSLGNDKNKTVPPGAAVTYNFPLSPLVTPTFIYDVALTATGLPPGATYTFTPASIPAGSGPTPVAFTVQTASGTAMLRPGQPRSPRSNGQAWYVLAAAMLMPLLASRRFRSGARTLPRLACLGVIALASLLAATGVSGCAAGGLFSGAQGQKTFTITIHATSADLLRTSTVQLNLE